MQKKHGFAPLGPADGAVKSAIFAGNAARLYELDVAAAQGASATMTSPPCEANSSHSAPNRSNLRYGYVAKTRRDGLSNCSRPTGPSAAPRSRTPIVNTARSDCRSAPRPPLTRRIHRSGHLARRPRSPARATHSLPEMKRILDDHGIRHLELEFLIDWFCRRRTQEGLRRAAPHAARKRRCTRRAAHQGRRLLRVAGAHVEAHRRIRAALRRGRAITARASCSSSCPSRASRRCRGSSWPRRGADQPNGGICVDLWHVVKLGIPYERVAAIPGRMSRASSSTTAI